MMAVTIIESGLASRVTEPRRSHGLYIFLKGHMELLVGGLAGTFAGIKGAVAKREMR
jgi:hypothetical protein